MQKPAPSRTGGAPTALLLSVGSELLRGEIVDTNAAELAAELARLGLELRGVRQLPDDRAVLADAFREARARVDAVITSGGLGPTHDDLTRDGLADALGESLATEQRLVDLLLRRFGGPDRMPESNLRQALVVPSAEVLENPIGSAPGWWVDRDGVVVVLMPGVPSEMRRMWAEQVAPRLARRFALLPLLVRTVRVFGVGESAVAARAAALLENPGAGIEAGIYAKDDGIHLRFSTRGNGDGLAPLVASALEILGEDAYGTDGVTLPALALAALARAGARTLTTYESGTDGALLTILAGHVPAAGEAQWLGGTLSGAEMVAPGQSRVDALLRLTLLDQDRIGRSRVVVSVDGPDVAIPERAVRIHGSGPQRARRAAYAALDLIRRELP